MGLRATPCWLAGAWLSKDKPCPACAWGCWVWLSTCAAAECPLACMRWRSMWPVLIWQCPVQDPGTPPQPQQSLGSKILQRRSGQGVEPAGAPTSPIIRQLDDEDDDPDVSRSGWPWRLAACRACMAATGALSAAPARERADWEHACLSEAQKGQCCTMTATCLVGPAAPCLGWGPPAGHSAGR